MDFRNDELLRENSAALKRVAEQTATENKSLVHISSQSASDSRTMRIATVIAMVYLPASLSMVSFTRPLLSSAVSS
jgi:hypothetical protein